MLTIYGVVTQPLELTKSWSMFFHLRFSIVLWTGMALWNTWGLGTSTTAFISAQFCIQLAMKRLAFSSQCLEKTRLRHEIPQ
jgi:hypothetical protein